MMNQLLLDMMRGMNFGSKVDHYTNKERLVAEDKKFLSKLQNPFPDLPSNYSSIVMIQSTDRFTGYRSHSGNVDLLPQNRVSINDLIENIDSPIVGKYFLCRCIMPPHKMKSIMTVVDDPSGIKGVRIALYNFTNATTNLERVLPVGSILAIKNPWFKNTMDGGLTVRSDSPTDVVMLDEEQMSQIFPGIVWEGMIPREYRKLAITSGHDEKTVKKDTLIGHSKLADEYVKEKKYADAIAAYTKALKIDKGQVDILEKRGQAYLKLRCYQQSFCDSSKMLSIFPFNAKGIILMARSLIGLKRYEAVDQLMQSKLEKKKTLRKNLEILHVKAEIVKLLKQSKSGGIDLIELMKLDKEGNDDIQIGDFTGPVKISETVEPSHGTRGVIATANITAGQLLICSKAFAFYASTDEMPTCSINFVDKIMKSEGHDALVGLIGQKLTMEPECRSEFYNLFAGPELGFISGAKDDAEVDMNRIDLITTFNAFSKLAGNGYTERLLFSGAGKEKSTGIWILPSYINHTCAVDNAHWGIFGDVIVVRAFKDIREGEEILINYTFPGLPYQERLNVFHSHEFICKCSLCALESVESSEVRLERENIFTRIDKELPNGGAVNISKVMKIVQDLDNLCAQIPRLNRSLCQSKVMLLASALFKQGNYENASKLMEKIHFASAATAFVDIAVSASMNNLICHIRMKTGMEGVWIQKLRQDLINGYGSVGVMQTIAPSTAEVLKMMLGYDIFQAEKSN